MSDVLETQFPRLRFSSYTITSPATVNYNCIAWAAGDDTAFWWPDPMESGHWPPQATRAETIAAFVEAFATLGYERCGDGAFDPAFEKVAIFVDPADKPTHAARQLSDGSWTSKLGQAEDIEHQRLDAVAGAVYGKPLVFLRRRARSPRRRGRSGPGRARPRRGGARPPRSRRA